MHRCGRQVEPCDTARPARYVPQSNRIVLLHRRIAAVNAYGAARAWHAAWDARTLGVIAKLLRDLLPPQ
ncbi:MAG: hypothetical protein MHM6MM_009221 [Cercozoa sp. M6MM]